MRRFFMVCRLGSFLLGLFILLSLLTGGAKAAQMAAADTLLVPEQWTYDGRFRDMSGLRCADAVKTSFDTGLLEGRQADRFDAVSELTNAQILVISARLYDRLTGGSGPCGSGGGGGVVSVCFDAALRPVHRHGSVRHEPQRFAGLEIQ